MTDSLIPRITEPISAYDLLTKVCEVITEEPKRYNQGDWIISREFTTSGFVLSRVGEMPSCGTVCCVAGWIETLRVSPKHTYDLSRDFSGRFVKVQAIATRTLGLTLAETRPLFAGEAVGNYAARRGLPLPQHGTAEYAAMGVKCIKAFQRKHARKLRAKVVRPQK